MKRKILVGSYTCHYLDIFLSIDVNGLVTSGGFRGGAQGARAPPFSPEIYHQMLVKPKI
jgi:hypothetical protein